MADQKILNNYRWLFLGTGATPSDTVVCIESYTTNRQKSPIDASSQCGPDTLIGDEKSSLSINAIAVTSPSSGKTSYKQIVDWFNSNTTLNFIIEGLAPVAGDIKESGSGTISAVTTTDGKDNPTKFTFDISVKGSIAISIEA